MLLLILSIIKWFVCPNKYFQSNSISNFKINFSHFFHCEFKWVLVYFHHNAIFIINHFYILFSLHFFYFSGDAFCHCIMFVYPEDTKSMPTQLFSVNECFESNVEEDILISSVRGKCSVLTLRDYQSCKFIVVYEAVLKAYQMKKKVQAVFLSNYSVCGYCEIRLF